tara:strand:- start:1135 stop:2316 length:1182 start_codon:yes stop_codon:yes gene_type:complete
MVIKKQDVFESAKQALAGLKNSYDIELSRNLCPPKESFLGLNHKQRIVVSIDSILIENPKTGETYQPREEINVISNWQTIKTSLFRRGWIHSEEPLFVIPTQDSNKIFILKSGFNRIKAMKELGYKYVLVDVYDKSDSLEDNLLFEYRVNNDNLPSAPMKDIDYIKAAVKAYDELGYHKDEELISFLHKAVLTSDGISLRTPEEIVSYETVEVELSDGTSITEEKLKSSCLLFKVRLKRGKQAHIRPLDGVEANKKLKSLGKGYAGDSAISSKEPSSTELGYAFEKSNSLHRIFWDGLGNYHYYDKPIKLYGYIMNPSSITLKRERQLTKKHYKDFISKIKQKIYSSVDFESLQIHNIGDVPFKLDKIFEWGGFIPQDESIESNKIKERNIIK